MFHHVLGEVWVNWSYWSNIIFFEMWEMILSYYQYLGSNLSYLIIILTLNFLFHLWLSYRTRKKGDMLKLSKDQNVKTRMFCTFPQTRSNLSFANSGVKGWEVGGSPVVNGCWVRINGKIYDIKNTVFSSPLYLILLIDISQCCCDSINQLLIFFFFKKKPMTFPMVGY